MVDLHKGFEGFENLEPSEKKKEDDELSLAKHVGEEEEALLSSKSDLARAETLYNNILQFITPIFNLVKDKKEDQIKGEEIMRWAQEYTNLFRSAVNPDNLVKLVFQHDKYRDNYIYTHSANICLLTARMALASNFSEAKLLDLVIASLFLDIGMMKIPLDMWNKENKLSSTEYEEVKKHALYGEEIFKNLAGMHDVVPLIIGQHQERCDGTGYPRHLTKEGIHYGARLLGLLDSYEAATHARLYKLRVLPDEAIKQILDNESSRFDPHFMKTMLRCISIFPVGTWVRISSGEIGKVMKINEETPMRPVLNICYDREGSPLAESKLLDLSKQLLIHVDRCIDPGELKKEEL